MGPKPPLADLEEAAKMDGCTQFEAFYRCCCHLAAGHGPRYQAQSATQWADLSAAAIMVSIPIVILLVCISADLVCGLTLGGVKGQAPPLAWPR